MRDDSGYKSLETQQSLGKSGVGVATAALLARIGTRSMDRAPPGLLSQPAAVVGRVQYSLEVPTSSFPTRDTLNSPSNDPVSSNAVGWVEYSLEVPSIPVKFDAASPKLKDIVVPVPQLAVPDVRTTQHHDESTTTTKTFGHSTLTEFFAGISSGSSQPAAEDPSPKKQTIPFVAEGAFLEKFAERTQTVGRALTSSFDRIWRLEHDQQKPEVVLIFPGLHKI